MKFVPRLVLPLALCVAFLVAASIGSSKSPAAGTGSNVTRASVAPGLAEALKAVRAHAKAPASIRAIKHLSKRPVGKTFAYMQCNVLQCTDVGINLEKVAPLLGAKIKKYQVGPTPETIQAAFERAYADKPSAVLVPALPVALYTPQLKKFQAAHIPVITWTTGDKPGNGIATVLLDSSQYKLNGDLLADWVVADSKGAAIKTVFFGVPGFTALETMQKEFAVKLKALCPSCGYSGKTAQTTSIGKDLPGAVISYLQANPGTKYVVLAFGSMVLGVPEALKAAGLSGKVKVVSQAGLNLNFRYIQSGGQAVDLTLSHRHLAYAALDATARALAGESLRSVPTQLPGIFLTKANLNFDPGANTTWPMPMAWQKQYRVAWGS